MATSASTFNKPSVRVLLADDSSVMRNAIRTVLAERSDEVELVGEATSFSETVELAWSLKPQVIVMDLHLPKRTATQDVKRALIASASRLLVISVANDNEAKELAKSYGANVFLDKMDLYNVLVPAIISLACVKADCGAAAY